MESTDMDIPLEQNNGKMENGHAGHGNGVVPATTEDSLELRILMAYAKKRRPTDERLNSIVTPTQKPSPKEANVESPDTTPKKKRFRLKLPRCLRPKTKDDDCRPAPAALDSPEADQPEAELDEVADKLTEISATVPFLEGDLDTDCPQGQDQKDIEELAKILRDCGDDLDEKIKNDKALVERLQNSFQNYGFFSRVINAFLGKVNLESTEGSEEVQIAMTCEAVTRLSAMNTLPVKQTMHFGASYLHNSYPTWFKHIESRNEDSSPKEDNDEVE